MRRGNDVGRGILTTVEWTVQIRHDVPMRIARVALDGRVCSARIDGPPGAEVAVPLDGDVFDVDPLPDGEGGHRLADVDILPPVEPSKIVAVGRNYAEHAAELGAAAAERPRIFLKPPSSVIAAGQAIRCPVQSQEVHHEAELAVVVGRTCRRALADDALSYVLGYTCANDVTARDIQRAEGLPSYAKSFDTFCPLGPWIATDLDPATLKITCTVNGALRQDGNTRDMLWSIRDLIVYISAAMTLLPGDVILTGTPAGVGPIGPGDEVTIAIEGIGTLSNPVVRDHD
jgi:2-keto-4-pentenoate hydratase/2-oxohepta-3-ene-1,7-dioic acid hydratase in catechol pathway